MWSRLVAAALGLCLVGLTVVPPQQTRFVNLSAPPNPQLVRGVGKSHLSLLADLAWIRSIAASIRLTLPFQALSLIHWCRFVTDLDPTLVWAYYLGGLLGPYSTFEQNFNVKEANELLEHGMNSIPEDYLIAIYLSYNQLHLQKDALGAARTLQKGARAKGAPAYLSQLATRLLAQVGDFDEAALFAQEIADSSDDPSVREFFARRRQEIARDRLLVTLEAAVDRARQQGLEVHTPQDLVDKGVLPELPEEPLGGEFFIDEAGHVRSTSGDRLKAQMQGVH